MVWKCVQHYSEFIRLSEQSTFVAKMKGFQRTQTVLAMIGFTPNNGKWNIRQISVIVVCSTGTISSGVNIFVGANNMQESMESFFMLKGLFAVILCFTSIIFNNDKLFEVIEDIGKEINLSGFKRVIKKCRVMLNAA